MGQVWQDRTFTYSDTHAMEVYLVGPFNNFAATHTPMKKVGSCTWQVKVRMAPDEDRRKIRCFVRSQRSEYGHYLANVEES